MKQLTMIFLLTVAVLASSITASAQSAPEVDVQVYAGYYPPTSNLTTGEIVFRIGRTGQRTPVVTATGVTISMTVPEGSEASVFGVDPEACAFAETLVTCYLGDLEGGIRIDPEFFFLKVKAPTGARAVTITARIWSNEHDPNPINNTVSNTVLLKTSRNKRTRIF